MSRLLRRFGVLLALTSLAAISTLSSVKADFLASSLGPNFVDSSVYRYEPDGDPIPSGTIPSFTAGLGFAQGITIGPDGNIYVSSSNLTTGAGEILFFDPSGTPLSHDGGQPGLFATLPFNPPAEEGGEPVAPSPAGLTFGTDGNLYVADREGTTVRVFDGATGMQLADAAIELVTPTGVAFGPDGALYVTNFNAGSVDRIENGNKTPFITPTLAGPYTPSSLLWLPTGNVLVVDVIGNQVLEYDGTGAFVGQFAVPPPEIPENWQEVATFPTNSPSQIIFDEDGNLVLALLGLTNTPDDDGALLRYGLDGTFLETISSNLPGIGGLVFIKPADAIAADYNSDGEVDENDYLKWKSDYGKWVAKGGGADGNGDGVVDAADYTVWRNNLPGEILAEGAAFVPEPATATLLAMYLCSASFVWRRS
jgi:hypothetical protein